MGAKLEATIVNPWIHLSVQNLTNNNVTEVRVTYQVNKSFEIVEEFTLLIPGQINPGMSTTKKFPVIIGNLSQQALTQYSIKILAITWINADGSKGQNTQWGQMNF
jgi:hypothetical protein